MPMDSQLLYFHLVLRADDDGIVEAYPVAKLLGLAPDNFKVLLGKGFIRQLNEEQVIVIMDWSEHNTIRADRKVNSIYLPLLKTKFPEIKVLAPIPRPDVKDNSRRVVSNLEVDSPRTAEVRLGKDKLGKDNKESTREKEMHLFWDYFLLKTNREFKLTDSNKLLIKKKLKEKYTLEQLKQAVDRFVQDDWAGRQSNLDLVYCIGKKRGGADNLEKWLHKPKSLKEMEMEIGI